MAKPLVVAGDTFEYPENRDNPGWGEEAQAWASAVTDVLSNVAGPGDILQTAAVIGNTASSTFNVPGLFFDSNVIRAAVAEVVIYRIGTTGITINDERCQVLTLYITYKSGLNLWDMSQVGGGGDSGVTLSISGSGQIQYTVTEALAGSNYNGTIRYRARALIQ